VTQDGNRFVIDGGSLSGDGANLFHSFQQLGLSANEIATFLSDPTIQNILGRVVGGDPSVIDGLLQVTGGNSNLFLMNPAGIVFGPNARLDLSGSFSATTATGIEFADGLFDAVEAGDFTSLTGNPTAYRFGVEAPGAIVNAGTLSVEQGQGVSLVGGTVINTGTIEAPGGQITVTAVPGTSRVRLQQPGWVVALEVNVALLAESGVSAIAPWDLPRLLTEGAPGVETGLALAADGSVQLAESGVAVPGEGATSIVSGQVNAANAMSGQSGGEIAVLGDRVGLVSAEVDASGDAGGGRVLVGGEFQGNGTLPNAERTYVSEDSRVQADGGTTGNGGEVIVWADDTTFFWGEITAQGGSVFGDGGFVEISGKTNLAFDGSINLSSFRGTQGQLILDPRDINIVFGFGENDSQLPENFSPPSAGILVGEGSDATDFQIGATSLEAVTGNIFLQANRDINLSTSLSFIPTLGTKIEFSAGRNINAIGQSISAPSRDLVLSASSIQTGNIQAGNGGSLNLFAGDGSITVGDLSTSFDADSGDVGEGGEIILTSPSGSVFTGRITSFSRSLSGDASDGGRVTIYAGQDVDIQGVVGEGGISTGSISFDNGNVSNGGDIRITAGNNIDIRNGTVVTSPVTFELPGNAGDGGDITLNAINGDVNAVGLFSQAISNAPTGNIGSGGKVSISAGGEVNVSDLSSPIAAIDTTVFNNSGSSGSGGEVHISSEAGVTIFSFVRSGSGNIFIYSDEIDFLGGENSVGSGASEIVLDTFQPEQGIEIGDVSNIEFLNLDSSDLEALLGFSTIYIGDPDSAGERLNTISISGDPSLDESVVLNSAARLSGPDLESTWFITGNGQGNINGVAFTSISSLEGGQSADNYIFLNNTILGEDIQNISDRGGENLLDFSSSLEPVNLELNRYRVGDSQVFGPSTGPNNIIGIDGLSSQWEISGSNSGSVTNSEGKVSFTNFQSLTGGNSNDIFELGEGSVATINGGGGNNALVGNDNDTNWVLTSPDAGTVNETILFSGVQTLIGGIANDSIFFSNGASLSGDIIGNTGNLDITGNVINIGENVFNAGSTSFEANSDIQVGNVTSPGQSLTILSRNGTVTTNNLTTASTTGASIFVDAEVAITIGEIDSSGSTGPGGNVILDPLEDVEVTLINTQGGSLGIGGEVDITAGRFFRATGTFTDQNDEFASISSAGGQGGGPITIRHGGGLQGTPFVVGDASVNGTAGVITSGADNVIETTQSFPFSYRQGNISIITPSPNVIETQTQPVPPQIVDPESPAAKVVEQVESTLTPEFQAYFDRAGEDTPIKTLSEIQREMNRVEAQTNGQVKPAVIYAFFVPV
jgi:filamentous hemagglutinin family protein